MFDGTSLGYSRQFGISSEPFSGSARQDRSRIPVNPFIGLIFLDRGKSAGGFVDVAGMELKGIIISLPNKNILLWYEAYPS